MGFDLSEIVTPAKIERELHALYRDLYTPGEVVDVDVRVIVWHDSREWRLAWGDVGYDTAHGNFCAAGSLYGDTIVRDLAEALYADLREQVAQEER